MLRYLSKSSENRLRRRKLSILFLVKLVTVLQIDQILKPGVWSEERMCSTDVNFLFAS